ncbi:MAG: serine hydrolase [Kosmotoga sp.]|uniref:serine hydrolase n=1 Tax=Kosmotoga sp. TaxID=1955248 RepID=UPI00345BBFCB|nr:serine hydrolase [Kosmotoga sp.]
MLNLPMADAPGEKFVYNTGASHLVIAAIQRITGKSALEFAEENLFHPLGITEVIWPKDSQGINKGAGLNMIPKDMAKMAFLCSQKASGKVNSLFRKIGSKNPCRR